MAWETTAGSSVSIDWDKLLGRSPTNQVSTYTAPTSIGNTSNYTSSTDNSPGATYQNVYNSSPYAANNQQMNTYTNSKGDIYDTSKMTTGQAYALQLNNSGNKNAAQILNSLGYNLQGDPLTYNSGFGNSSMALQTGSAYNGPYTPNYGTSASTPSPSVSYSMSPTSQVTPTTSNLSSSQQSAQDWINNSASGQGGIQNYIKTQLDRYNQAVQSGDTNLINALKNDANRVGYTLPNSTYTSAGAGGTGTGQASVGTGVGTVAALTGEAALRKQIEDQIKARNDSQILALNQELARANQARQLGLTQNQNALNEGLGKINTQESTNRQALMDINNRRGGLYSGGTDYSLGNLASSSNEARSSLQRDASAYNADITGRGVLDAEQIAAKISQIQQAAPSEIQTLVQQALAAKAESDAKARQQQLENDIKLAGITGYYNDSNQRQAVLDKMAQNSAAYASASPAEQQRLHAENVALAASIGGQDTTGEGDYAFGPGTPTLNREKQEYDQAAKDYERSYNETRDKIKDEQYWAKFDRDAEQWGLEYAATEAFRNRQLSIQEANSAISAAREDRLANESSEKPPKVDSKESADNSSLIMEDLNTEGLTKADARALAQANKSFLTDSDYSRILKYIDDTFE